MRLRTLMNSSLRSLTGYEIVRSPRHLGRDATKPETKVPFSEDGLTTYKNVSVFSDPRFERAYESAVLAAGWDYGIRWRTHVMLWASEQALKVPGDFVELGTGRGWMFSAICDFVDIDDTEKKVFLFDRYSSEEIDPVSGLTMGRMSSKYSKYYAESLDETAKNFSQYSSVTLMPGSLPQSLSALPTTQLLSLVHLDLNAEKPEIESLAILWPQISSGGLVVLDDYAWPAHANQYAAHNKLAHELGVSILTLPTGQGLIIK